jgi:putative ABC transport system substrate-binding protein
MRRREFIALMGASVAWPFAAMAQQPGRTYRLGFLVLGPREAPFNVHFLDELRRLGFVEGQNLTLEFRTYGNVDLISQSAAELVNARVDAIVVAGEEGIRALQQATKTIPIVAIGADLLGSGFVNSVARPDANTTGVSMFASETDGKRLDILIEAVPGLRLMAVLTSPNSGHHGLRLDALQEAARAHGIESSIHRVFGGEEIAAAIDSAQASGATALSLVSSPLFYAHRHLIIERAAAARLPVIYEWPETAEEGGFAAYGPRASVYSEIMPQQIAKLFRGTKVADIPVEQPTKFELVINLKTAKAMGVTVPESLLVRADKVIE